MSAASWDSFRKRKFRHPLHRAGGEVVTGATVRVTGTSGDWSAVDIGGQLGFIQKTEISGAPSLGLAAR